MADKEYVWYVCYGSNLCYERFMRYINKCTDKTPPRDERTLTIPYEMYFAQESSQWNDGGVCFIKLNKDPSVKTYAKAYLITREQYNQIHKAEGLTMEWYGNDDIELPDIDGIPCKTFTSGFEQEYNKPDPEYIGYVMAGLMDWGLSKEAAKEYLKKKIR